MILQGAGSAASGSVEQVMHGGLGPFGHPIEDAFSAQAGDGAAGDHPGGHGQVEADDAAEEAAQTW
jgi:hypothetical protein